MQQLDQATLHTLRWRAKGLVARSCQAAVVGALVWLQTRSDLAVVWIVAALVTGVIDSVASARVLARLDDRRFWVLSSLTRVVSAATFIAICFIILSDHTAVGLVAATLIACATSLNNAVMTRGSGRFVSTLVLPSAAALVILPLVAWATGNQITLTGAIVLMVGGLGYSLFIARLAQTLARESEAMATALEAAENASRAKSSFLAVTSHEIRTPLNGVLGMAQAMEHDDLSAAQRDRVGVIRQSGEALLQVLNDILDVAKIEAGKLELENAAFDLEAVAGSAFTAFRASAASKDLAYELDIEPAARGVFDGDATRLRQVICNLISNAVKFTDTGEVRVSVAAGATGLLIRVRDTGPGIPADLAERLFDRFTQADSSTTRRFGGTGLGLAICRDLCEAMGGTIRVESEAGRGSTFVVDLPLTRSSAPGEAAPAHAAAAEGPLDGAQLRVLAAEDNPINQVVLRTLLQQIGVEPLVVETGEEAVQAWEAGVYDLILMDIQMPKMDGPAATRAIRAREAATGRARTPIIALTANVMTHQIETYLAEGMDGFVAKPIAIGDLYATIERCLGVADGAAEAAA
jgi:signal transduction histidine kinase/CheY-like chemotaxis protein